MPADAKNIGEDQKKRSSLFVMRPLIFLEAPIFLEVLDFSLPSLLINPALPHKSFPDPFLVITKGLAHACMTLVVFSTFDKFKNHCSYD